MRSAVILAAGRGTRLRSVLADAPKGFLSLGEKPIIEESLARLSAAGIADVVIVAGYQAEYYQALARRYPLSVRIVHNERFAESGSLYSLYCARNVVSEPFLLLESDIVYEQRALSELMGLATPEAILLSSWTGAGDEVFVETQDGFLKNMSKNRALLGGQISGELVGISKISPALFDALMRNAARFLESSTMLEYEIHGLVEAAKTMKIPCPVADGLVWAEIDDEKQLQRVRERIYPLLAT